MTSAFPVGKDSIDVPLLELPEVSVMRDHVLWFGYEGNHVLERVAGEQDAVGRTLIFPT
jgi:hypothetical protein